ncbi:MAG: galactokinase [Acidimicrobiales bacterium]
MNGTPETDALDDAPERLLTAFHERFHRDPAVVVAPGRVNLIGDHTDYNDGFVLPAALQFTTWAAASERRDRSVTIESLTHRRSATFELDDAAPRPRRNWSDYVRGVAIALRERGIRLVGVDVIFDSTIPVGAGLSSSAALETSAGLAMATVAGVDIDKQLLARAGQWSENRFVGVRTGIMDQYTSSFGAAGKALLLDCRSLQSRLVTIPSNARFVVANTMSRRALAAGAYNTRREQCEAAVAILAKEHPQVTSLRDVTLEMLLASADSMPPVLFKRAHHVVTENARVVAASSALEEGDLESAGALMNLSHESLRDDFEVSSRELDTMVVIARSLAGVYGSRMTGGGFGGATISLVEEARAGEVVGALSDRYAESTGVAPSVFIAEPSEGACVLARGGTGPP